MEVNYERPHQQSSNGRYIFSNAQILRAAPVDMVLRKEDNVEEIHAKIIAATDVLVEALRGYVLPGGIGGKADVWYAPWRGIRPYFKDKYKREVGTGHYAVILIATDLGASRLDVHSGLDGLVIEARNGGIAAKIEEESHEKVVSATGALGRVRLPREMKPEPVDRFLYMLRYPQGI